MAKQQKQLTTTAYEDRHIEQVKVQAAYTVIRDLPSIDRPLKVHEPIESMFNGKKSGLNERQFLAGQIYAAAYEAQFAGLGEAMNFDKVRGPRNPTMSPPDAAMAAAARIRHAGEILKAKFEKTAETVIAIVERVAGRGYTVDDCARQVYGGVGRVSGHRRNEISQILKAGLDALADAWHGEEVKTGRIRGERAADAKPTTITPGSFSPGGTRHASKHKGEVSVMDAERAREVGARRPPARRVGAT